MKSKSIKDLFCIILVVLSLSSCGTEPTGPPVHKFFSEISSGGLVVYNCCAGVGTDCSRVSMDAIPISPFRVYLENGNIADFFRKEDWGAVFPELKARPDIVDKIIEINPKGVIKGEGNNTVIYLLIDREKGETQENILHVFTALVAENPCNQ